jgi:trimethylamine--corrinoid protein Co-methyltransferase
MKITCQYLSDVERERIHRDSLKILAEVGVLFRSATARKILARSGAKVDEASQIVKIPKELVAQALATAPKNFTLGARNAAFDFAMPSAFTGYTLDGAATFTVDAKTGERRYAVAEDMIASLRIFEELPLGTVVWPNVVLSDIPEQSSDVRTSFLSLMNSSKHIQHEVHAPEHVPFILEGLAAILGSEAAIKERKIFSVCYCTIPPLTHDDEMCDACLELAKFHVPILPYPMPAPGSTGPASLYSDIAVANAESLSALVLFQLAAPGAPVIHGGAAGATNFNTGGFVEGAPESNMLNGAMADMARFYRLPTIVAGGLSDAKAPGAQAMMEKMFSTLPLVMAGVDVINGIGEFGTSQMLLQEQIVVDHEMAALCKRMKDGIEVGDAKDLFEDVMRVGPGGNFLMEDSTVMACRSEEFSRPELVDRGSYEQWVDAGRPDMYAKARARVAAILAEPLKNPLPDKVVGRLEEIMRRADEELKHE